MDVSQLKGLIKPSSHTNQLALGDVTTSQAVSGVLPLKDIASQLLPGLTQKREGQLCLTIPTQSTANMPTLAWVGEEGVPSLSIAPPLLRVLLPRLSAYLGLQALAPDILERLAHQGGLAARAQLALPAPDEMSGHEAGHRAILPSNTDLCALAETHQKPLLLDSSEGPLLVTPQSRDNFLNTKPYATVFYGEEQVKLQASESVGLLGVGVISEGTAKDAILIQTPSYLGAPVVGTAYRKIRDGFEMEQFVDTPTALLATKGGAQVLTTRDQTHIAPVIATCTNADLVNQKGRLDFLAQSLLGHTEMRRTEGSGGLFGETNQHTHITQTVRHTLPTITVSQGPVTISNLEGDITAEAPQIKTQDAIHFKTSHRRSHIKTVKNQIHHESVSTSEGFVENVVKQGGHAQTIHQEATFEGAIQFEGELPLIEARLDGSLQKQLAHTTQTLVLQTDQYTSWHHEERSLGVGAQALIGLALTIASGGITAPLSFVDAVTSAAVVSLGTSAINNAYAGRPLLDERDLKNALPAIVSAGLTAGALQVTGYTAPVAQASTANQLATRIHEATARTLAHTVVDGVQGKSVGDALTTHALTHGVAALQGLAAREIGVLHHGPHGQTLSSLALHGTLGAATAAVLQRDPTSGALGAVVGELAGQGLRAAGLEENPGVALSQAAAIPTAGAFNQEVETASAAARIAAKENAFMVLPAAQLVASLLEVTSLAVLKQLYDQGYFQTFCDATFETVTNLWEHLHMDAHIDSRPQTEGLPSHPNDRPQILATPESDFYARDQGFDPTLDPRPTLPGFEAYAGPDTSVLMAEGKHAQIVEIYEIGQYNDLKKRSEVGDNLEVHHVPQKHPAKQVVERYNPQTAPSIVLSQKEHKAIPDLKGSYNGNLRDLVARDARNLRNYTEAPNGQIQKLIQSSKEQYPKVMKKGFDK